MARVTLKIDISGTLGDEAWRTLRQFEEIQHAAFGSQFGTSGPCHHSPEMPHSSGEWRGAQIQLPTSLLAQYAIAHYLEQARVLDADIEESGTD